jgi:predicted PurR-regulated permease PerM
LLWGVATGVASVLPLLGSALVWIPAAVVLFIQGSVGMGVFMLIWGLAAVGTVDNILRPLVVSGSLPVNGFVILIAMLGGAEAFGVAGILIGPLAVALILALAKIIGERFSDNPVPPAGEPEAKSPAS